MHDNKKQKKTNKNPYMLDIDQTIIYLFILRKNFKNWSFPKFPSIE